MLQNKAHIAYQNAQVYTLQRLIKLSFEEILASETGVTLAEWGAQQ